MSETVHLHKNYSKDVAERFYLESITQSCFSKDMDMQFTGVKGVIVNEVNTVELNNYNRTLGANRYGNPTELEDTEKEYLMERDRSFTFIIDKGNNMEQDMIKKAGECVARELREVVTPEIDTHRLAKWAASAGKTVTVSAPTKTTIFSMIVDGMVHMDNQKVPKKNRTIFVGSKGYSALLQCSEFLSLEKTGNKAVTNGEIGKVLGMTVKYVPDTYLPSGVVFMIVLKDSAISPMKLHEYKVHTDPPGISGHLAEGRFIYDAFVKENKKDGIYVAKIGS